MLKTRLAEKDAQLMGGFGALSNMRLGGTRGWFGGLPDPETIAASLADQARPYIHPRLTNPRPTAWGVGGSPSLGHASSSRANGNMGPVGMPQELLHSDQAADSGVARSANASGNYSGGNRPGEPGQRHAAQGPDRGSGLSMGQTRVSREAQGSPRKPNQARPVLSPLVSSQNQLQSQQPGSQSLSGSIDSNVDFAQAASEPAAELPNAASLAASGLGEAASRLAALPEQMPASPQSFHDSSSGSRSDLASSSESESDSDSQSNSSSRAYPSGKQLPGKPSQQTRNGTGPEQQAAALQQERQDADLSLNSLQSSRSNQSVQDYVDSQKKQVFSNELQPNAAQIDFMLSTKSKKKWRMFG